MTRTNLSAAQLNKAQAVAESRGLTLNQYLSLINQEALYKFTGPNKSS